MDREQAMMDAEKKRTNAMLKVLIPITAVVIVLTVIVGFFANKAGNKSTVTANEFIEIAYHQKLEVNDVKDELNKDKEMFKTALIAMIDEDNSVYFLKFGEKQNAKSYFANAARGFKSEVKESGTDNSQQKEFENYCYYTATANGKYMYVTRVKNTVLYANVDEDKAEEVKKLIKSIGY